MKGLPHRRRRVRVPFTSISRSLSSSTRHNQQFSIIIEMHLLPLHVRAHVYSEWKIFYQKHVSVRCFISANLKREKSISRIPFLNI